ncbi:MAG: hypothetical protein JSV08_00560 [Acidobacteriota bacterium]|nr:MAG: hypothetical protein JSV08_00560 [Acidobacteriota bacterium]
MQVHKEKRRIHAHLFVWMIALVVAPSVSAKGYMTNGFRTKETRPLTLVLLPPHAEFIKAKAVMTEEMVKECRALEDAAASWITTRLGEKAYTVQALSAEEIVKNPELSGLVKRVNDRYGEEWSKLVRRPRKLRQGRYNIGDDTRKLCSVLEVDGLLIARVQAVGVTAGRRFLSGGINALLSPSGYGRMDVSVVNGKTGAVDAYFFFAEYTSIKSLTKKQDKFMKGTSKGCFRRYPAAAEVLKARGRDDEAEEEEDEGEEDIIGEFEALLGEDEEGEEEQEQEAEEEPSAVEDAEGESEESQSEEAQE